MSVEFKSRPQLPDGSVTILLVEDDSNDVLLVERAMKNAGLSYPLIHKQDGEEANRLSRWQATLLRSHKASLAKVYFIGHQNAENDWI